MPPAKTLRHIGDSDCRKYPSIAKMPIFQVRTFASAPTVETDYYGILIRLFHITHVTSKEVIISLVIPNNDFNKLNMCGNLFDRTFFCIYTALVGKIKNYCGVMNYNGSKISDANPSVGAFNNHLLLNTNAMCARHLVKRHIKPLT